jgi:tetratricopeptide (TPR) repeat protein
LRKKKSDTPSDHSSIFFSAKQRISNNELSYSAIEEKRMGHGQRESERAGLRILIADDLSSMRRTMRNMLNHLGYMHVVETQNGLEAWEKLATTKIDLAIVDWNMPQLTGVELLRKVRADAALGRLPFIIITGEIDEEIVAEAAETQVDAYIIKPFVAKTLEEKIINVLDSRKNSSPIDTHLLLSQVHASAGQFDTAMEELKKALNVNFQNPRIYFAIGDLYDRQGRLDDAEKAYRMAVALQARFARAYDGLANVYAKKGEIKKSIQAMKEAISRSPRNASRQMNLGKALLEGGMAEEAKAAFDNAVKVEPRNLTIKMDIGEMFLAKDMDHEAAELFEAVLKANPNDVHVYNRLGMAYRKQGKFLEAIEEYKKALKLDPSDENLYYNLGRAYMEARRNDDAMVQFIKALEIYPEFHEAREILVKIKNSA